MESIPSSNAESSAEGPVPKAVVNRLSLYVRELQHLVQSGCETISSTELGKRLGFTNAQVRKDLAYFGQFGYPGIGYRCLELIHEIKRILGTDRPWPLVLIGLGNLGRALINYRGFSHQGFRIAAAFDIDPHKVGSRIDNIPVFNVQELPSFITANAIRLAVLAVPAEAAQGLADALISAGIEGILNFAPVTLSLPKHVQCIGVDLAIELEQLSFAVVHGKPLPGEDPPSADDVN